MKTLYEYILEAQIDGLKNVKIIRHYTTGAALKNILASGVIEPHESEALNTMANKISSSFLTEFY